MMVNSQTISGNANANATIRKMVLCRGGRGKNGIISRQESVRRFIYPPVVQNLYMTEVFFFFIFVV